MAFLLDRDLEFDLEFGHLASFSNDFQVNGGTQLWTDASISEGVSALHDLPAISMTELDIAKNRRAESLDETRRQAGYLDCVRQLEDLHISSLSFLSSSASFTRPSSPLGSPCSFYAMLVSPKQKTVHDLPHSHCSSTSVSC
ncbi:hypothetical protein VKT23_010695 [Stygiomarasmius scandens]|uniref:Uncharacterized protein n=1 Tax=Marasmiellus scandens TaxID=2682957 RepID=A0ABR1JDQ9_9AGAR